MLIENGLLSEILTALTALIRFFAGMDTYMLSDAKTKKNVKYVDATSIRMRNSAGFKIYLIQNGSLSEEARTVNATVRFFIGVYS